ncbi:hypothetical protein [Microbacterium sp. cx-59]|uniref:hypothetical protein n=1 Tax=Microbacterium sp. cx-59 TaxID=2891207 RepID=UPI001E3D0675|nr:hypothetical protein [Microbacterium sp. cx-59]MCC4906932.1 hypothetical protein [Microbacterium sp. cx-59]
MAENTEERKRPQGLSEILASIRPGADVELGEEMSKLIDAVKDTGKAGTLTYTISVKLADGSGSAVIIGDKIAPKRPEKDRATSIAYVDGDNYLTRTDPNSMPLWDEDIRDAGADPRTGEIKEAPNA